MAESSCWEWNGPYPTKETWETLKEVLEKHDIKVWHCFWDEPWAPWAVRVFLIDRERVELPLLDGSGHWRDITDTLIADDRANFGDYFYDVQLLFTAASGIAMALALSETDRPTHLFPGKLVHCLMNIWGYSRTDEAQVYSEWATRAEVLHAFEQEGLNEAFKRVYHRLPQARYRGRLNF